MTRLTILVLKARFGGHYSKGHDCCDYGSSNNNEEIEDVSAVHSMALEGCSKVSFLRV